jgi:hypothetical protein
VTFRTSEQGRTRKLGCGELQVIRKFDRPDGLADTVEVLRVGDVLVAEKFVIRGMVTVSAT